MQNSYQEDFYAFAALSLDPEELQLGLKKHGVNWDASNIPESIARQVLFVGIYDGHGGSTVSQFLRQELHGLFESADSSHVPDLMAWIKELGGYFRRFKGGVLTPWIKPDPREPKRKLDLEARATLAFFEASTRLYTTEPAFLMHALNSSRVRSTGCSLLNRPRKSVGRPPPSSCCTRSTTPPPLSSPPRN